MMIIIIKKIKKQKKPDKKIYSICHSNQGMFFQRNNIWKQNEEKKKTVKCHLLHKIPTWRSSKKKIQIKMWQDKKIYNLSAILISEDFCFPFWKKKIFISFGDRILVIPLGMWFLAVRWEIYWGWFILYILLEPPIVFFPFFNFVQQQVPSYTRRVYVII